MSTPAVFIPPPVPTLPNLYDALPSAEPAEPAAASRPVSATNELEPRKETLLASEPFEWIVSFDDDVTVERTVPAPMPSEEALELDDADVHVENLKSGIRSAPPPLPAAAGLSPALAPPVTLAPPVPTPSQAPPVVHRHVPPARGRLWSDD